MSATTESNLFTKTVKAPVEHVYFAFTNATALEQWLCNTAEITPNENGRIYLWWNVGYATSGIFKEVEENSRLVFSWHGFGEPAPTSVEVTFAAAADATKVTIQHTGLGDGEAWQKMADTIQKDWPEALENLVTFLEDGVDKRQFERPMLGIFVNGLLDAKQAVDLGVPVETGVVIGGVIDEMGAQKAGLQQNDVLVGLAGHEITDFPSIGKAIADKKAGDEVNFTVYRGAEKMSFAVDLGKRPLPNHPTTAAGLAEQTAQMFAELDQELDTLFADVSDEAASKRPAPEEWSAKETVAHLLYTERWTQLGISLVVGGQRMPGFYNDLGAIAALADGFPTTADIIAELKQAEVTTVRTLANLSDEFVANKGRYFILAGIPQFTPGHHRLHFQQMKAAIEQASN